MKIVQIAPIEEPVPPRTYGGTELVIHNLTEELVRRGHDVYLLASGDSSTEGTLVPMTDFALRVKYANLQELDRKRQYYKYAYPADVIKTINTIRPDIIHNHYSWRILHYSNFMEAPMVSTLHGPLSSFSEERTYRQFENHPYVSISDSQRKSLPDINWVKTVYNGIDMNQFEIGDTNTRDYFAFLGRASPEKGLFEICTLIKKTNYRLKIAAKIDPVDVAYFYSKIQPLIDGKQIEFIGEINPQEKREFLKRAKALLLWLNWEEPFGLVVVEAMASGTPVIVNNRGSMSELIVDTKTGYLVKSRVHMLKRLHHVEQIDPEDCRKRVEDYFSKERMTDDYLTVYREVLGEPEYESDQQEYTFLPHHGNIAPV
ncbi:glycosyltransferase family 4 protein [Candidatus Roizmanbacteria bacterium]|nr:glycosyltransferase family 4 protein [Candidatus Roizmanbacteria bacterium]